MFPKLLVYRSKLGLRLGAKSRARLSLLVIGDGERATSNNVADLICRGIFILFTTGCAPLSTFEGGKTEALPIGTSDFANPKIGTGDIIFKGDYEFSASKRGNTEPSCVGDATITVKAVGTTTVGLAKCQDALLNIAGVEITTGMDEVQKNAPENQRFTPKELNELRNSPALKAQFPPDHSLWKYFHLIRWLKSKGYTSFTPLYPDFISPVIQNVAAYEGMDVAIPVEAVFTTPEDPNIKVPTKGVARIVVHRAGFDYKPEFSPTTYKNCVEFSVNNTGFEGIPRKARFDLHSSIKYIFTVDPVIKVLNVSIEGPLEDFEESWIRIKGGSILFKGGIKIQLKLRE